jgi:hypothetical protein
MSDKKNAWANSMVSGAVAAASDMKAGGRSFASRLATVDALQAPQVSAASLSVRRVPLDEIRDREADLRPINPDHVLDLAMSIAAVGLLQFPVVDQGNRLLAGGHRREAVKMLRQVATMEATEVRQLFERGEKPDRLSDADVALLKGTYEREFHDGVVVRVFDTTGLEDGDIHVRVEAIENEKRLDFTKAELVRLVERFVAAGYRDVGGRPKEGERVLSQELERVMGKSRRTVFRLLAEIRNPQQAEARVVVNADGNALAKQLTTALGTSVSVRQAVGEAGSIIIRYSDLIQRSELLRQLGLAK